MYRFFYTLLFSLLTISSLLEGQEAIRARKYSAETLRSRWMSTLKLEHAVTPYQLAWGLMGRDTLPPDTGMTFNFPMAKECAFWMFNCQFDLSVAYLDGQKVIREIHALKAYPEKMDLKRPVRQLTDLADYPESDPIVQFFMKRSAVSGFKAFFALETNKGWFAEEEILPGDVAIWNIRLETGFILHTVNIDQFKPKEEEPILLEFPGHFPHAVWMPEAEDSREISFFSTTMRLLRTASLEGGAGKAITDKEVVASGLPTKYLLVSTKGWSKRHLFKEGITVEGDPSFLLKPQAF